MTKIKLKKLFSATIILAGISGALIISLKSAPTKNSITKIEAHDPSGTPNLQFKTAFRDEPSPLSEDSSKKILEGNLTDAFASSYLLEIFKRNPESALEGDNSKLTLPSQETFEGLLGEYANKNFEWGRYDERDLKILKNNSLAEQKEYIAAVRAILQKNFDGFGDQVVALESFLSENNPKSLQDHVAFLKSLTKEALGVSVPENSKAFQLQLVNVLQKEYSVYNAILNLFNDPLNSFSALNEIIKTAEELKNLNTALETRRKEISS